MRLLHMILPMYINQINVYIKKAVSVGNQAYTDNSIITNLKYCKIFKRDKQEYNSYSNLIISYICGFVDITSLSSWQIPYITSLAYRGIYLP
jgi:hypothetical protein